MKLLKRLAAVLLGSFLAMVALEGYLRLTDSVPKQQNSRRAFHDYHERLGWLGTKNYTARFQRDGFDAMTSIDERGFRLRTTVFAGSTDAPVVAFLGDSYTWGYGVSQGEVFTDKMQTLLGSRVRVENFGVSGFGTGQQRLLLEEMVLDEKPQVVTVMYCNNDLEDNADDWGGRRPWFRLEGDELVLENSPVSRKIAGPFYALMRRSLAMATFRFYANVISNRRKDAQAAVRDQMAPPVRNLEPLWRLQAALFREMRDICVAADPPIELRVVYVPGLGDTVGTPEPQPGQDYPAELAEICADLGIAFYDLSPDFEQAWRASEPKGPKGEPLLFTLDSHWTSVGHDLAARVLVERFDWPGN